MTEVEYAEFIDKQVQQRWPRWEPTQTQLDDWHRCFIRADYQYATEAVRRHATSEKRMLVGPHLGLCLAFLREIEPRKTKPTVNETFDPRTGWFVECVEASDRHPNMLGWKQRVCVNKPEDRDDESLIEKLAVNLARSCENVYKGRFAVVRPKIEAPETAHEAVASTVSDDDIPF